MRAPPSPALRSAAGLVELDVDGVKRREGPAATPRSCTLSSAQTAIGRLMRATLVVWWPQRCATNVTPSSAQACSSLRLSRSRLVGVDDQLGFGGGLANGGDPLGIALTAELDLSSGRRAALAVAAASFGLPARS